MRVYCIVPFTPSLTPIGYLALLVHLPACLCKTGQPVWAQWPYGCVELHKDPSITPGTLKLWCSATLWFLVPSFLFLQYLYGPKYVDTRLSHLHMAIPRALREMVPAPLVSDAYTYTKLWNMSVGFLCLFRHKSGGQVCMILFCFGFSVVS